MGIIGLQLRLHVLGIYNGDDCIQSQRTVEGFIQPEAARYWALRESECVCVASVKVRLEVHRRGPAYRIREACGLNDDIVELGALLQQCL